LIHGKKLIFSPLALTVKEQKTVPLLSQRGRNGVVKLINVRENYSTQQIDMAREISTDQSVKFLF
jgi:hypothetical protein